ncbi:hypothetical protein DSECCO2_657850 [anaerobic digester metagenome]
MSTEVIISFQGSIPDVSICMPILYPVTLMYDDVFSVSGPTVINFIFFISSIELAGKTRSGDECFISVPSYNLNA